LLKATVLTALYSIRSERPFCERLSYDLLFKIALPIQHLIQQTGWHRVDWAASGGRLRGQTGT